VGRDGGEVDGDGRGGDGVDGDGSEGTSPSWQGAGTETSVPRNLSSTAALRNCSGKNADFLGFFIPRLLIGEKAASEVGQGGLTIGGRGQGLSRAPWW
jgi:hypothetical protein